MIQSCFYVKPTKSYEPKSVKNMPKNGHVIGILLLFTLKEHSHGKTLKTKKMRHLMVSMECAIRFDLPLHAKKLLAQNYPRVRDFWQFSKFKLIFLCEGAIAQPRSVDRSFSHFYGLSNAGSTVPVTEVNKKLWTKKCPKWAQKRSRDQHLRPQLFSGPTKIFRKCFKTFPVSISTIVPIFSFLRSVVQKP